VNHPVPDPLPDPHASYMDGTGVKLAVPASEGGHPDPYP